MATKRVRRIERLADGGLLVELSDGSTVAYRSAADLPADLAEGLLARMDAAGESQAQGDADAARDAYRRRLEQAHQQGEPDPGAGLRGVDAYRARLEAGWQQGPAKRRRPHSKHWGGA